MDWSALEALLQCEWRGGSRVIVLILGGLTGLTTLVGGAYNVYRWVFERRSRRRLAKVLRVEAELHARLKHRDRARLLYDLAIKLNPRAAHAYYLRGLLRKEMNDLKGAIADWGRCVDRLPSHRGAQQELARHNPLSDFDSGGPRLFYVYGAGAVMLVIALLGIATR